MRAARAAAAALARGHPRHVVLAAGVAGLLAGPRVPPWLVLATVAVLVLGAFSRGGRAAVLGLAAALALAGGAVGAHARLVALDRTALAPWIGHAVDLRVVALEDPRPRAFGRGAVLARIGNGPGAGEGVLVRARRLRVDVGAELRVRGGLRALPAYESAARRRGAHALVDADTAVPTGRRRGGAAGALDGVRRRARDALARGLPPELGGLARGMVLGEGGALPQALSDDVRTAGMSHLVAASGANVALLVALVLGLAGLVGVPLRTRLAVALASIAAYVPLAGGGPSIQRAGVMGAATIVAALASSAPSRVYALLLAAAATLAANPRAAEDPGWQMSFAAVTALIAAAPRLRARLGRRLPQPVADAVAITVAASIATAPLVALHFDRVSVVALPANVAATPAVPLVMWLGVAAALVAQLAAPLATPFTALAAWPLALLAWLAGAAASVPGAEVTPASAVRAVAALALGAVVVAIARRRITGRRAASGAFVAVACALVLVLPLLRDGGEIAPPHGLVVSALDVGQGDATLIQHGTRAILVDAGPADGGIVGRVQAAGARRLDALVVTHAQADHEGGAAAVLEALPVGVVLDGRDGVAAPDGRRWAALAARRRVRVVSAAAGQVLRAGPLELEVLSPSPRPRPEPGDDPNRRAIVAELRTGTFSMLLTADAESDVLAGLPLRPVDVLKVSHHGSVDDGLGALLERLRPALALIEVGRGNRYGHPAPSTLAALRTAGVPVLRTDRDGTVRLRPDGRAVVVERHR